MLSLLTPCRSRISEPSRCQARPFTVSERASTDVRTCPTGMASDPERDASLTLLVLDVVVG